MTRHTFLLSLLLLFSGIAEPTVGLTAQAASDTEDRGFIHPGGLHTQADFDRVKQQLADGDSVVTAAYNILQSATYAQPTAATYPTTTIVRGGSGENYMNAAWGATIAYQNALRWKIGGNEACAQHAVDVLMAWARTTTGIGGDSNYALAAGIYGYEFAQAAELMRDYTGWSADDFATFQKWMLDVWYPSAIGFLRTRNGTWENASKWWRCPGHYWSNWGLCNAMAVISIGILCDDVYIYNQGMSFFKYDQVGTFVDPRTADPLLNDGLTEFLGNLVVTTTDSPLETGAYGKLGQMQESGRDVGHCALALGMAVDIAHIGYNQGDDLFSYMDNRLAAGVEYVAAQCLSVDGLPWTNYKYATNGIYWTDSRSWLMTAPVLGAQIRPYWGTIIGHYEGVKGVDMPFAHRVYDQMGIDGGGTGSTSGGYDHLGYSVLMNTRDKATATTAPTVLTPQITVDGETLAHNELGGLTNTYTTNTHTGVAAGTVLTLNVVLPDGETNTGQWLWNTGETTQSITVVANQSNLYRATYTNTNGVKSQQVFAIAVQGDTEASTLHTYINGTEEQVDTFLCGDTITLRANGIGGYGTYAWSNGSTSTSFTVDSIAQTTSYDVTYTNQGGATTTRTLTLVVRPTRAEADVDDAELVAKCDSLQLNVEEGQNVTLRPVVARGFQGGTYLWSDGSTASTLVLSDIRTAKAGRYTCTYTYDAQSYVFTYIISVEASTTTFDATPYVLQNADFETTSTAHWDYAFAAYNNLGYQSSSYTNGDVTISHFIECWRNGSAIGDGSIKQTIAYLPQGTYTLGADAIASWQKDASVVPAGVNLFAGTNTATMSTANGKPEHFTLDFTQDEGGTIDVGLSTTSCSANWIAADNFTLTLQGGRYDALQFRLALLRHHIALMQARGITDTEFQTSVDQYASLPQGTSIKTIDAANADLDEVLTDVKHWWQMSAPLFRSLTLADEVDTAQGDSIATDEAYQSAMLYLQKRSLSLEQILLLCQSVNALTQERMQPSYLYEATKAAPIDLSAYVLNPDIYQENTASEAPDGWTAVKGNADNGAVTSGTTDTDLFCYSWSGNSSHNVGNRVIYQQLRNLPRGRYMLQASTYQAAWSARIYVSIDNSTAFTTADLAYNYDNYLRSVANDTYTTTTDTLRVDADSLYLGVRGVYADYSGYIGGNGRSWRADRFRLLYCGYLPWPGDLNGDGLYTISDLTQLIALLKDSEPSALIGPFTTEQQRLADVNGDNILSLADVTALANKIL